MHQTKQKGLAARLMDDYEAFLAKKDAEFLEKTEKSQKITKIPTNEQEKE